MYINMYWYRYTHLYITIYIYTYIHIYVYIYIFINICVYMYIGTSSLQDDDMPEDLQSNSTYSFINRAKSWMVCLYKYVFMCAHHTFIYVYMICLSISCIRVYMCVSIYMYA
jgi:hypothetical protein